MSVLDSQPEGVASEDGVYLNELEYGAVLELVTKNHRYTLVKGSGAEATISGHPGLCPKPVTVRVGGSRNGAQGLRLGFIGRGMHLIFEHPLFRTITTSRIIEIHRIG